MMLPQLLDGALEAAEVEPGDVGLDGDWLDKVRDPARRCRCFQKCCMSGGAAVPLELPGCLDSCPVELPGCPGSRECTIRGPGDKGSSMSSVVDMA